MTSAMASGSRCMSLAPLGLCHPCHNSANQVLRKERSNTCENECLQTTDESEVMPQRNCKSKKICPHVFVSFVVSALAVLSIQTTIKNCLAIVEVSQFGQCQLSKAVPRRAKFLDGSVQTKTLKQLLGILSDQVIP